MPDSATQNLNARDCPDSVLLERVKRAVAHEREATQQVLLHLLEVERRRLYLKRGFASLFDFCIQELGYCAGSAHLRIQGMRLLREVSDAARAELTEKLASGRITLSQLSNVQTYSRQVTSHRVAPAQKLEILAKLEGKPTRESQKIILGELGLEGAQLERLRVKGADQVELTITLGAEAVELLEEWKALTSHANPEGRNSEAVVAALRVAVERARKQKGVSGAGAAAAHGPGSLASPGAAPSAAPAPTAPSNSLHAHEASAAGALPVALRRLVWARDGARCTYEDTKTGKRCDGTRFLEVDHVMPRAVGGRHELKNLRLLCSGHHRLRHIEDEELMPAVKAWPGPRPVPRLLAESPQRPPPVRRPVLRP